MTSQPRKIAEKIVRKSRHYSTSATGERYQPMKKFVENLYKNIELTLIAYGSEERKKAIEECAKVADNAVPHHTECGFKIARAIRKLNE